MKINVVHRISPILITPVTRISLSDKINIARLRCFAGSAAHPLGVTLRRLRDQVSACVGRGFVGCKHSSRVFLYRRDYSDRQVWCKGETNRSSHDMFNIKLLWADGLIEAGN